MSSQKWKVEHLSGHMHLKTDGNTVHFSSPCSFFFLRTAFYSSWVPLSLILLLYFIGVKAVAFILIISIHCGSVAQAWLNINLTWYFYIKQLVLFPWWKLEPSNLALELSRPKLFILLNCHLKKKNHLIFMPEHTRIL